mmetsp:Transcript_3037/g.4970  ORF Transcript_3037/g.4970 Transcript_3037/m.4970 type:complete len:231 (-) Transcript_3037:904-1596(-)
MKRVRANTSIAGSDLGSSFALDSSVSPLTSDGLVDSSVLKDSSFFSLFCDENRPDTDFMKDPCRQEDSFLKLCSFPGDTEAVFTTAFRTVRLSMLFASVIICANVFGSSKASLASVLLTSGESSWFSELELLLAARVRFKPEGARILSLSLRLDAVAPVFSPSSAPSSRPSSSSALEKVGSDSTVEVLDGGLPPPIMAGQSSSIHSGHFFLTTDQSSWPLSPVPSRRRLS